MARKSGIWAVAAAACVVAGCANSPPMMAPGLASRAPGESYLGVNLISNFGTLAYADTLRRFDGAKDTATYENTDFASSSMLVFWKHLVFGFGLPNAQVQAFAGGHWDRRVSLVYFPTFSVTGRQFLHGVQLDVRLPKSVVVSASLYGENLPSDIPNPALGQNGEVNPQYIQGWFVHVPWTWGPYRIWISPNYRHSLEHSLYRYGVNLGFSAPRVPGID